MESLIQQNLSKPSADNASAGLRKIGILIADDMALILTMLKVECESLGYTVWLAVDGDDAIDLYRRHRTEIDMVLLDVDMPGLDGPHTLDALQKIEPDVLACFMTGSSGMYSETDLLAFGAAHVFKKPFRVADVAACLEKIMETAHNRLLAANAAPNEKTRFVSREASLLWT